MNILIRNNVNIQGNINSNRAIIFANGFGTDQTSWERVIPYFEKEYKIVLYDHVGSGKSVIDAYNSTKYSTFYAYTDDLIEICENLGLQKPLLVAHSYSSMVGLLAAIKIPGLFSKIVMMNASARYLNDRGYYGGLQQSNLEELFEAMETNYHAWVKGFSPIAMDNPKKPELARQFADSLNDLRPDIAVSVAKVIYQSDYRSELPKLIADVLLIQCDNDIAVPKQATEYLHQNILNSRLIHISGVGHFPHISAPEDVVLSIKLFI